VLWKQTEAFKALLPKRIICLCNVEWLLIIYTTPASGAVVNLVMYSTI